MSGKIKSTLELAMEKAAKLPRLTEEEIRQRREEEYAPRGRAIAALALEGGSRRRAGWRPSYPGTPAKRARSSGGRSWNPSARRRISRARPLRPGPSR